MHRLRNQLTISTVALVLGFLVVVQLRVQQSSPGLAALSAQNLTVLVANLNTRNDQLRTEVARLERELAGLTGAQSRGETSVDQIRQDLARLRAWSGLEPVVGPGVTITISGAIEGAGVEDLINELHNAGAEAIAVEDVRVVPGAVVAGPGSALSIENTPLGDPFEVRAIGSPETLTGSLTRIGGVIAQLAATYPLAELTVTPVERLELPATERDLVPRNGRPRL
ncbi:MAG TPA: DUF881 domain-containing protein [Candidatus Limnocylindrales bacterium]|jgi:uncharacterized protein YlxW (UPF0749 family)|nr:DUF881 domain-containing protein [Candidatus Limnocylindrales bacterium]